MHRKNIAGDPAIALLLTGEGRNAEPQTDPLAGDRVTLLEPERRALDSQGPTAFGMFSCSKSTNEMNYAAQKFIRTAIGSNNIDSCNRT